MYCQVMDAIYPGTFSMAKVKWGAKFDYEYVENYKVLQNAFDKNGIKKHIDVSNFPTLHLFDRLINLSKPSTKITLSFASGLKDFSTLTTQENHTMLLRGERVNNCTTSWVVTK